MEKNNWIPQTNRTYSVSLTTGPRGNVTIADPTPEEYEVTLVGSEDVPLPEQPPRGEVEIEVVRTLRPESRDVCVVLACLVSYVGDDRETPALEPAGNPPARTGGGRRYPSADAGDVGTTPATTPETTSGLVNPAD